MRWVLGFYLLMSVVTFTFYGFDKRRAIKGGRRVPEARLHWLELLGGWPGAFAGQLLFRHKTQKLSFRVVFWLIVVLHLAGWAGWFWWRSRA